MTRALEPVYFKLSEWARRQRSARGLSLRDVERLAGVDKAALSRLERATHRSQFHTVVSLAQFYGVEP
jgi:transcriptional regulator with XRE-family HTH domain